MSDFMKQLSSYNLFNYLLPGVIFATAIRYVLHVSVVPSNVFVAAFIYYFIGMVISRIGSLVIEPFLKKAHFVHFAPYADFVAATKVDPGIEVLSEANNTYRTLLSCAAAIGLAVLWQLVVVRLIPGAVAWGTVIVSVGIAMLFLFAYRKQSSYIRRRVEANGVD